MNSRTSKYRLHKPTSQAVVTIDGRDWYLGKHGTEKSKAEYDRLITEWLLNGLSLPQNDLTVNELLLSYVGHCDG